LLSIKIGGEMPIQKQRLTNAEYQDHLARLLRCKNMGISVGCIADPPYRPERLTIALIDHECPTLYELPLGDFAIVAPIGITVRSARTVIMDYEMRTDFDDGLLDLTEPEAKPYFRDLVGDSRCINRLLVEKTTLYRPYYEGVILAHHRGPVPTNYHDNRLVRVELLVWDYRDNELPFAFEARIDRSLKRRYARSHAQDRNNRKPIFKREDGQVGDQPRDLLIEAIKESHDADEQVRKSERVRNASRIRPLM
jgi:hypothetical protein